MGQIPKWDQFSLQKTYPFSCLCLIIIGSSFFDFHYSFFIIHSSLFILHYSLFILHYSFFILHYSFFIIHCSLFLLSQPPKTAIDQNYIQSSQDSGPPKHFYNNFENYHSHIA